MKKLDLLKYAVLVISLFLSYQAVEAHDKKFSGGWHIYFNQRRCNE